MLHVVLMLLDWQWPPCENPLMTNLHTGMRKHTHARHVFCQSASSHTFIHAGLASAKFKMLSTFHHSLHYLVIWNGKSLRITWQCFFSLSFYYVPKNGKSAKWSIASFWVRLSIPYDDQIDPKDPLKWKDEKKFHWISFIWATFWCNCYTLIRMGNSKLSTSYIEHLTAAYAYPTIRRPEVFVRSFSRLAPRQYRSQTRSSELKSSRASIRSSVATTAYRSIFFSANSSAVATTKNSTATPSCSSSQVTWHQGRRASHSGYLRSRAHQFRLISNNFKSLAAFFVFFRPKFNVSFSSEIAEIKFP